MKKLYTLCYIVMAMGILGTAVLIYMSPEIVPVHYNFAGEVDRFGSKYENLLWPFFSVAIGGLLMFVAKKVGEKEGEKDEKIILYVALATLILFMVLGSFFMIKAIQYDSSQSVQMSMDSLKFIGIILGAIQIVLGVFMPKMKRNSYYGLRNKWTMANDNVWQKSHRFGGKVSVICGIIMIGMTAFMSSLWNYITLVVIVTIWVVVSTAASYYYYKNEKVE
ncbi:MAG: SdpI family protein [Firmicutes bacterium]|nr:SdpI family protein [Bacillota bacterium]